MRAPVSDMTITAPSLTARGDTIFVAKGTSITIDMVGVSYNARNYPNPYSFNPRRWASKSGADSGDPEASLDSFLAFGAGPRVCLGKKFSTVEATCFLSNILRDWKFDIKLENGESMREWQERVMKPDISVTLRLGESLAHLHALSSVLKERFFRRSDTVDGDQAQNMMSRITSSCSSCSP